MTLSAVYVDYFNLECFALSYIWC